MSDLGVIWRVPALEMMILQQGGFALSLAAWNLCCRHAIPVTQGTASGQGQVLGKQGAGTCAGRRGL